ncbi:MAG: NAD+ synthase [Gammaproteobacteria bacterium]|nr:NAD+ synthase [Gammaproteobacteria bacterium]MCW8988410.1 NAD+ synthase [Gammaproteobacteria bacterium]
MTTHNKANISEQTLRIAIAQINLLVGDIEGNAKRILEWIKRARDENQADIIVFPELALTGYPPEDLLLRPGLYERVSSELTKLMHGTKGITAVVGYPEKTDEGIYNAVAVLENGSCVAVARKKHLPNYSVFDEKRYFIPSNKSCVFTVKNKKLGICICEDIWYSAPVKNTVDAGAGLILNLNASPFHAQKTQEREDVIRQRVDEVHVPIVYANLVGGQDELVFDGQSFVIDADKNLSHRFVAFEETLEIIDFDRETLKPLSPSILPILSDEASIYQALVTGVRDYVAKNGFPGVVIGLSGGIDSALTLSIAVDALGADKVEAVMMPSCYTLDMSVEDAKEQAELLGVNFKIIPIEKPFNAFLELLEDEFAGKDVDATEENIQARCRGLILMAISNKKGKMVLTTGNKSEMAVGYATLYGDMAGGYNALKDVKKTLVFRLAEYRNSVSANIPQRVIERPPSAELAPDQKDTDSLPEYEILDDILECFVERDMGLEDIVAAGFERETVRRVLRLIDVNEYKRRQAAPGVRITRRAFGRDRRYPITSGYGRHRK